MGGLFCCATPDSASATAPPLRAALTCEKRLLAAGGGRTLRTLNILFSVRRNGAGQKGGGKPGGRCGRYFPSTLQEGPRTAFQVGQDAGAHGRSAPAEAVVREAGMTHRSWRTRGARRSTAGGRGAGTAGRACGRGRRRRGRLAGAVTGGTGRRPGLHGGTGGGCGSSGSRGFPVSGRRTRAPSRITVPVPDTSSGRVRRRTLRYT